MERFAVGVNCGVYDVSIVKQMSGKLLLSQYENFAEAYIATRRAEIANRPRENRRDNEKTAEVTYREYEKLIRKMR